MGAHPLNLTLRFLLELSALASLGVWGWHQSDSWLRFLLVIIIPTIAAVVWGIFAVPNDPSRSGSAPVAVPGIVRLALEFAFFGVATWALLDLGHITLGWAFGIIVVLHYLASYDRIKWLIM